MKGQKNKWYWIDYAAVAIAIGFIILFFSSCSPSKSTNGNPQPVVYEIHFTFDCDEPGVKSFEVEYTSKNLTAWYLLSSINAIPNKVTYTGDLADSLGFYRVKVNKQDGNFYYSNVSNVR